MELDLINKKTGEIGYLIVGRGSDHYVVANNLWDSCGEYDTLAELNEEWEDYDEHNGYWFIDYSGYVPMYLNLNEWNEEQIGNTMDDDKEIGNYFETKEEAEKAVEKLKAWKRLKELGFRFIGETCEYKSDKHFGSVFFETNGYALDVYEDTIELYDDLELLFGGEE